MHHGGQPMPPQRLPDAWGVCDVAFLELAVTDRRAMPGRQIVEHDHAATRAREGFAGVAADVTGTAGHQDAEIISGQWKST